MSMLRPRLAPFLLAATLAGLTDAAAEEPYRLLHSFFDPGTNTQPNTQHGSSVAVDSYIAVAALPDDDAGGPDSGVVKIYERTTGALLHMLTSPTSAETDRFGSAVATSGTRVVVGAEEDASGGILAGCAYVYDLASATPNLPVVTLINPWPKWYERFGAAVAISGTRVVVGTHRALPVPNAVESVYIYDLAGAAPAEPIATLTNPSPADFDSFGRSVAMSGTLVVVGAYGDDTGTTDAGSAYVYDLASVTPTAPVTTLTNPSPVAGDLFGFTVAISGTRMIVGAAGDDTGAENAGSAYVYDHASATPSVPVVTLTNPMPAISDGFGGAVAISGMRAVIGASYDDTGGTRGGSAYVYDLASSTPTLPVATLDNPGPPALDSFGAAVAISGTLVVVGAPYDDTTVPNAGSAYLYELDSAAPTVPVATLDNPSPALFDWFGNSVAISGTRVVVGTPLDDTGAMDAGVTYVYDLASANPAVPVFTLTNPSPAAGDWFGSRVAISGSRVVVGAYLDDAGDRDSGSAYVYDLASGNPTVPTATFTSPTPAVFDLFGVSVAISGTHILIGASYGDAGAIDDGCAYLYDLTSAFPTTPVLTLTNPSPALRGQFGNAVAISGTRAVIGANYDDLGAIDAGSAYVFDLTSANPTVPIATLTNPSPAYAELFGHSVAISGTRVLIGAPGDDATAAAAGTAYLYDLAGTTPTVPTATLTNPSPAWQDGFGVSVAICGTRLVIGAYLDDVGQANTGSAYVYDLTSPTPTLPIATLFSPSSQPGSEFGFSVAVDGTTVAIGAASDDTNGAERGAVHIFGLPPALSIVPAAPGFATISWTPAASSGFVLQYTDGFAPANWLNAPGGAANPVTVPTTNSSRFYRLWQP